MQQVKNHIMVLIIILRCLLNMVILPQLIPQTILPLVQVIHQGIKIIVNHGKSTQLVILINIVINVYINLHQKSMFKTLIMHRIQVIQNVILKYQIVKQMLLVVLLMIFKFMKDIRLIPCMYLVIHVKIQIRFLLFIYPQIVMLNGPLNIMNHLTLSQQLLHLKMLLKKMVL